jgi:hypothetical protein
MWVANRDRSLERQDGERYMDKNIGPEDRVIRVVVGLALAFLIYKNIIASDVASMVTGVIAAYLIITGLLARCIFYKMIDVDTSVQEQSYSTTDDRSGL